MIKCTQNLFVFNGHWNKHSHREPELTIPGPWNTAIVYFFNLCFSYQNVFCKYTYIGYIGVFIVPGSYILACWLTFMAYRGKLIEQSHQ